MTNLTEVVIQSEEGRIKFCDPKVNINYPFTVIQCDFYDGKYCKMNCDFAETKYQELFVGS